MERVWLVGIGRNEHVDDVCTEEGREATSVEEQD